MWYLGFDCATKTFAYSLSYINLNLCSISQQIRQDIQNNINIEKWNTETKNFIQILEGETIDMYPDRPDSSISTMDRINGTYKIVEKIKHNIAIRKINPNDITVAIEFQMGVNAKSRVISVALATLFSSWRTIFIGPSLKNKISIGEFGKYCYFIEKTTNTYQANKAHAKYNFGLVEKLFTSNIPKSSSQTRGHIADSFMQVLGFIQSGITYEEALKMF